MNQHSEFFEQVNTVVAWGNMDMQFLAGDYSASVESRLLVTMGHT